MVVVIRELTTPKEFQDAEAVQKKAWGTEDLRVTPKEIMIAIGSNGGIVLGAYEGDEIVGVSLGLPGRRHGKSYMYSHITGVAKDRQSSGIGLLLKKKQRELSGKLGYDLVAWTFDPIIARNAYFNFVKLGVVSRTYFVNYYGPMNDAINFGWETDRFLGEEFLDRRMVKHLKAWGSQSGTTFSAIRSKEVGGYLQCHDWSIDLKTPAALVDIPRDVVAIKSSNPEEAQRWRTATREVFQAYFKGGFTALRLIERPGGFSYLLRKVRLPKNVFAH